MLHTWKAEHHAQLLTSYRGEPRVDEALELLRNNDYHSLLRVRSKMIRGPMTWANIASSAAVAIGRRLLEGDVERAADAAEDAHALVDRLRARDAHPSARVTKELRARIALVEAMANGVEAAVALRDETAATDDLGALGRLLTVRGRWHALRRELDSAAEPDWVRSLVLAAAGTVLASKAASGGAKAMAARTVSAWTDPVTAPPDAHLPAATTGTAESTSVSTSTTPSNASPRASPPPTKRVRLTAPEGRAGEQLTWTDADDLLT